MEARHVAPVAVLLVVLTVASSAVAQRAVALDGFVPAPDDLGFVTLTGTRTPGPGRFHLGLHGHLATDLLRVRPTGADADVDLVERRLVSDLAFELGLGGRAALLLGLPLVLDQAGDALAGERELTPLTASDARVGARYRLLGESAQARDRHRDGPGVALAATTELPTGDATAYAGEGATGLHVELLGDFQLLGAGIGAGVGFRHRFHERTLFDLSLRDAMTFAFGLKVPIPPLLPLVGVLEVRGQTAFEDERTTPVEGSLGARATFGEVTLVATVGAGLTSALGAPGVRAHLGLWWAPTSSDADADGISDDADACPFLPEDFDGFEDTDGCEDPDNDNDLIPDLDDRCPNEEALEDRDDDEDGCTDPVR